MDAETAQQVAGLPDWLNAIIWLNVIVFVVWAVMTALVHMRRSASNLTPVNAPDAKKSAAPDFLSVDQKARREQIRRGEAYEKELDRRDEAEAEAAARAARKPETMLQRLAGIATFLLSIFTLLSTAVGVIFQVNRIGDTLSHADRLGALIQQYPIPFAICVFVIGYHVVLFFVRKQWKSAP
jgi:hypothetical protein